MRETCPMHTDELITGVHDPESGGYEFTCPRSTGHAFPGPFSWVNQPEPPDLAPVSQLAVDLGLDVDLPRIFTNFGGTWVEYGVVEHALAESNPAAFHALVARYGHTAIGPTGYSASAFIGATLGRLAQRGEFLLRREASTGRWSYNQRVSWCAAVPPREWDDRMSWESTANSMNYVPGCTEK